MKIKAIILVLFIISNLKCLGQNGIYFTKAALSKDSIAPDYTLISYQQKTNVNFGHSGQVATFKINEIYAYSDKNGELVRVHPKDGPQKMFVEGSICMYTLPQSRMEGRGGPCPEMTAVIPNAKFYISASKTGELLEANPRNFKKLLENDEEIFEMYKLNKNVLEAVCSYNKKHPTAKDKFYYRGKQ